MAAVVAVAGLWKPQLATTAVACLVYSCLRSALNLSLSELLFASPASAVCLLGCICVFPLGLLTYQASSGSSAQGSCGGKASIRGGCSAIDTKQAEGQDTQLGECSTSQATDAAVRPNLECSSRPVRLAEPPFSTDLPRALGNNRQLLSSSSKLRRRRLPHLSIELTPLPRLSVDFSGYRQSYSSYSRQASIRRSLDRGSMLPSEASGMLSSSCWSSCEGAMPSTAGAAASGLLTGSASLQLQQQLPTHAVGEATDSLGLSELPAGLSCIEEAINETHLLQVGAMLGESSSRGALAAREAGGPVGHPSSFYGSADTCEHMEPWELLVSEGNDNVLYWGWRKPLRKGLFMYMTRSVFLGASPAELRAFMMDDAYRVVWDQSMTVLKPLLNAETCGAAAGSLSSGSCSNAAVEAMAVATAARMSAASETGEAVADPHQAAGCSSDSSSQGGRSAAVLPHESAVMQATVQFPKPMASRSYMYARRVWPRPSDGGCYCLSKACPAPGSASALPGRGVSVEDYSSGCVIRAPSSQLLPPGADAAAPAAEVFMVYFEDSRVRASLANLGIKKGLWPLVQRTEKALRVYQAGAAANLHLQPAVAPAVPAACDISCSSIFQSSGGVSQDGARPAAARFSRSVSLSGGELGSEGRAAHAAAALTRSVSMQSEHTRRLSSGSLPCFPLEAGLEEDEPAQEASCCCSHQAAASNTACSSSSSPDHAKVQQQQQREVQAAAAAGKPSGSRWGWLGRVGSQLCGVIKQSTQLLAAASVVLWRSGPTVAMLLPSFEWRVVRWALQHITAPKQLLLGAPVAVTDSSCKAAARLPHSHPLGEWARPGLTSGLTTQVVQRLPSHPLTADELAGDSPTAVGVLRPDPALELRLAFASSSHGTASIAGSCGGSDVTSYSVGCSTCGCCCGGSTGGSSSGDSRSCHRTGGSSSSGGSVVHDESGGKRHRRVVVKLVQIAGLRVARRVARLAGITE